MVTRVPLTAHPNNMAVGKDGKYIFVGIIQDPGGVDVVETATHGRITNVQTKGTIHNVSVTSDRQVRGGRVDWRQEHQCHRRAHAADRLDDGDQYWRQADEHQRKIQDGSTKWIFVQVRGFNGFAVVDFATHKEINRIKNATLPPGKSIVTAGSDPSHGMAVTADGRTIVVCSCINNYLYWSWLPDLKYSAARSWVARAPAG